jgi:hypothetical protein
MLKAIVTLLALVLLPLAAAAQSVPGNEFGDLEARLRLDPVQKAQFDAAVGATRRAMLASGLVALEMKSRLAQELARDRPDLDRLLADPDALVAQVRPQWREAHEEWARFYDLLDARQVAIARDYIERRLGLLEGMGDMLLKGLRERLHP